MIEEMRMKNVYKIELRSSNRLSYDGQANWLRNKNIPLKEVRGKLDVYWINKYVQLETSSDCFYIGANGDLRAWQVAGDIFSELVVSEYPFSNMRQVRTDINDEFNDDGINYGSIVYARTIIKRGKKNA